MITTGIGSDARTSVDPDSRRTDIIEHTIHSICSLDFLEQADLYIRFCQEDGFSECGKWHEGVPNTLDDR